MIEYIEGNIFDSPAQVIVNTVNTVGVMGKGLALSFKQRYPDMFESYKTVCEKHQLTIGKLMLYYKPDHWILLFPTKENWRNPSKLEYIEKGLLKFVQTYAQKNINSIAFPRLGCGNGELDWDDVKPLMEKYLKNLPIDIYIYLGNRQDTVPEHKEAKKTLDWLRKNAKDMSFNGLRDDLIYISSMMPYEFSIDNQIYEMQYYNNKIIFTATETKTKTEIEENILFSIWDKIRHQCVFSEENVEFKNRLVFELLYSIGYLSKIKLQNSKTGIMENGYQINAGLGRALAFEEG